MVLRLADQGQPVVTEALDHGRHIGIAGIVGIAGPVRPAGNQGAGDRLAGQAPSLSWPSLANVASAMFVIRVTR